MRRALFIAIIALAAIVPLTAHGFSMVVHYSTGNYYVPFFPYYYTGYRCYWGYYDLIIYDVVWYPFPWFVRHWRYTYYSPCGWYRYRYYDYRYPGSTRVFVNGRYRYRYPEPRTTRYVYTSPPSRHEIYRERYSASTRAIAPTRPVTRYRDAGTYASNDRRERPLPPDPRGGISTSSLERALPERTPTQPTRSTDITKTVHTPRDIESRSSSVEKQSIRSPEPISPPSTQKADLRTPATGVVREAPSKTSVESPAEPSTRTSDGGWSDYYGRQSVRTDDPRSVATKPAPDKTAPSTATVGTSTGRTSVEAPAEPSSRSSESSWDDYYRGRSFSTDESSSRTTVPSGSSSPATSSRTAPEPSSSRATVSDAPRSTSTTTAPAPSSSPSSDSDRSTTERYAPRPSSSTATPSTTRPSTGTSGSSYTPPSGTSRPSTAPSSGSTPSRSSGSSSRSSSDTESAPSSRSTRSR